MKGKDRECIDCGIIQFTASKSIRCFGCHNIKKRKNHIQKQRDFIISLEYIILNEPYKDTHGKWVYSLKHPICHHEFDVIFGNILKSINDTGIEIPCTICGKKSRQRSMTTHHYNMSKQFRKDVLEQNKITWEEYRDLCRYFTRQNYQDNIISINPNNLELGHAKYHIDHKISIFTGCKNGIHPKIISGHDNLQVIWFKDNIKKGKKLLKEHNNLLQEMIKKNEIEYPDFKKLLKDFVE